MNLLLLLASAILWGILLYMFVRKRVPFDNPNAPRVRAMPRGAALLFIIGSLIFTLLMTAYTVLFGLAWLPMLILGGVVLWALWQASRRRPVPDVERPAFLGPHTHNSLVSISLRHTLITVALATLIVVLFGLSWLPLALASGLSLSAGWQAYRKQGVVDFRQPQFLGHGTRNSLLFISLPGTLLLIGVTALVIDKDAWLLMPILLFSGFLTGSVWWLAFQAKREENIEHQGKTAA